jgi:hypothetical protein
VTLDQFIKDATKRRDDQIRQGLKAVKRAAQAQYQDAVQKFREALAYVDTDFNGNGSPPAQHTHLKQLATSTSQPPRSVPHAIWLALGQLKVATLDQIKQQVAENFPKTDTSFISSAIAKLLKKGKLEIAETGTSRNDRKYRVTQRWHKLMEEPDKALKIGTPA